METKMKLLQSMNGFQRLGILAGVAWIMFHANTVIFTPTERSRVLDTLERETVARAVINSSKDAKKEYPYDFSLINSFDHLTLPNFIDTLKGKFPEAKDEINKVVSANAWSRLAERAVPIGILAIPPVCFFIVGSLLGWVVSGFKKAP